ncbi:hypothetical protein PoB_004754300 [Plakobranchus ocellatus]|uniref:Uncharacterized protein n=1 Tax=Plakobranchus ocellatus TaxID=259542 RepID=A0AAV4BN84_9GAST|nr:hypothetical protein PoB_004754300 [Plakobranchus ocellatus]
MGTSSQGSERHRNHSNGRFAKTQKQSLTSPRPWSDLNDKTGYMINSGRSDRCEFRCVSARLPPAIGRGASAGLKTCVNPFQSPRPDACLTDRERNGYHRTGPKFQGSQCRLTEVAFSRPQSPIQPRPLSSVTDRVCLFTAPSPPQPRCTLEDLPMQYSREEALVLLQQKRAELLTQRRTLDLDGGQIRHVSNFGRRQFDAAVSSRGKGPLPSPSADEAAVLFFKASRPPWSATSEAAESSRAMLRPHSISAAHPPQPLDNLPPRRRPDSEPPGRWHEGTSPPRREFNHVRYQRQVYPIIHSLVQRYNKELKVVCSEAEETCEARRLSRDFSVASEFYLVPSRRDEPVQEIEQPKKAASLEKDEEEEEVEEKEAAPLLSPTSENDHSIGQRGSKAEDQLSQWVSHDNMKSDQSEAASLAEDAEEAEAEPTPPWRCWVDDATVSTVHSYRTSSEIVTEEATKSDEGKPGSFTRKATLPHHDPGSIAQLSKHSIHAAAEVLPKPPSPAPKVQPQEKKGRKRKEEAKPLTPPPVEEPVIVVEEIVEESETEPEPEPEPVPPPYICPSSEAKSHDAEIRRWLSKSPFRSAARTVPIF